MVFCNSNLSSGPFKSVDSAAMRLHTLPMVLCALASSCKNSPNVLGLV